MTKEIPWGRVLVEGVVIVASILLAFGVDAWWAERAEKRAEREELANVRQELASLIRDTNVRTALASWERLLTNVLSANWKPGRR
jgi:hypothetical protein